MKSKAYCWVVERGCYSDYCVLGVFTSRKYADEFAQEANMRESYEKATVAKWPLNPGVAEMAAGMKLWSLTMSFDGTTERIENIARADCSASNGLSVWKRTEALHWKGQSVQDAIQGSVWARDEKHAVKIANEFRVRMIVDGKLTERK